MTERIDHAAEAWEVWRDGIARGHPDARDNPAHESLLHMVNALVEQQRIANLIAATQMEGGPYRDINRWTDGDRDSLSTAIGEIREGLGL